MGISENANGSTGAPAAGSGGVDGGADAFALVRLTDKDREALRQVFQYFSYETSRGSGADVGANGRYPPPRDFDDYCAANGAHHAYFILTGGGKIAGAAVVRPEPDHTYLRHFIILPKYRMQKVGSRAARALFLQYAGRWRVSTMDFNLPAIRFWENVCGEAGTGGKFTKTRCADDRGPQYEFHVTAARVPVAPAR